jgi:hypothetical protein
MEKMNMENTEKLIRESESTEKYWNWVNEETNFIHELNRGRYIIYALDDDELDYVYDCDQRVDVRVLTVVIRRLQEIESHHKYFAAFVNHKGANAKAEWKMHERAVDKAWVSLNRILARYTPTPTVKGGFEIEWRQHSSKGPQVAELRSILEIIEVARERRISDLRQCPRCGKWFIAKFPLEQYCGVECIKKFFARSMAYKQRPKERANRERKQQRQ